MILAYPRNRLEISISRLGERDILDTGSKITFYRDRDDLLIRFFTMEDDFVYCDNFQGLLSEIGFLGTTQMNGDCL